MTLFLVRFLKKGKNVQKNRSFDEHKTIITNFAQL
jgi:hypothetical protein